MAELVVTDRRHWALTDEEKQKRDEQIVKDRLAIEKPVESGPAELEEPKEETNNGEWKSVGYMIAISRTPDGTLMTMGRAVGLREDNSCFVADYLLSPIYQEGFDWTKYARKRLDTFLKCSCKMGGHTCATHKLYLKNWMEQDVQRLNSIASQPVPEAIEVMMKAEMARRNEPKIMAPGR